MSSLVKCANCGKKPTVGPKDAVWHNGDIGHAGDTGWNSSMVKLSSLSGKKCLKCREPYSGHGDVCPSCRKFGQKRGSSQQCRGCGDFFFGYGNLCEECVPKEMPSSVGLEQAFQAYCGAGQTTLDGRSFTKLCKGCGLIDKKFTTNETDIIFSKVVPKGRRRMGLKEFMAALEQVARKKVVNVEDVHDAIAELEGPLFQGTEVGSVRFHDDKWKYTGTHKNGGPDAGKMGVGTATPFVARGGA